MLALSSHTRLTHRSYTVSFLIFMLFARSCITRTRCTGIGGTLFLFHSVPRYSPRLLPESAVNGTRRARTSFVMGNSTVGCRRGIATRRDARPFANSKTQLSPHEMRDWPAGKPARREVRARQIYIYIYITVAPVGSLTLVADRAPRARYP